MVSAIQDAAKTDAETAKQVILRAAEILESPEEHQQEIPAVIEAVRAAWTEFLDGESETHRNKRTYHRAQMINDVKWHVAVHGGADTNSLHPIHDWEQTLPPDAVAETLKEAARAIAEEVRQRTINAGRLGMMSDAQIAEHMLMRETKRFLRRQGLEVDMEERDDPAVPIDYWGTVNGSGAS
jgi:AcrR family transcriptional regulator